MLPASGVATRPPPAAPQTLDRYQVDRCIGRGGMAEVYHGQLQRLGGFAREVAVKILLPQLAGEPEFVNMLMDEARIAAAINHPNVVQMLDVGQDGVTCYLVMEYVDGTDLRSVQRRHEGGRVPLVPLLYIIAEMLRGLTAIHTLRDGKGAPLRVVHRDVTPSNVLITKSGVVKLADFGIAHASGRLTQTRHGAVKGKTRYMAPEQLDGRPIDSRTDLFAAGVVLLEALLGRDAADAWQHTAMGPIIKIPARIPGGLPGDIEAILRRALAGPMDARFDTAAAFRHDVLRALHARTKDRSEQVAYGADDLAEFVDHILGLPEQKSQKSTLAQRLSRGPLDAEPTDDEEASQVTPPGPEPQSGPKSEPVRALPLPVPGVVNQLPSPLSALAGGGGSGPGSPRGELPLLREGGSGPRGALADEAMALRATVRSEPPRPVGLPLPSVGAARGAPPLAEGDSAPALPLLSVDNDIPTATAARPPPGPGNPRDTQQEGDFPTVRSNSRLLPIGATLPTMQMPAVVPARPEWTLSMHASGEMKDALADKLKDASEITARPQESGDLHLATLADDPALGHLATTVTGRRQAEGGTEPQGGAPLGSGPPSLGPSTSGLHGPAISEDSYGPTPVRLKHSLRETLTHVAQTPAHLLRSTLVRAAQNTVTTGPAPRVSTRLWLMMVSGLALALIGLTVIYQVQRRSGASFTPTPTPTEIIVTPPKDPAAARETPPAPGHLLVSVPASTRVIIDGVRQQGPHIYELLPGKHEVRLIASRHHDINKIIELHAGDEVKLAADGSLSGATH